MMLLNSMAYPKQKIFGADFLGSDKDMKNAK